MVKKSFEGNLKRLEEIVSLMSEEKMGLDEAIKYYQEGTKLGAECLKKISSAEKEVKQLVEKDNTLELKPFKE